MRLHLGATAQLTHPPPPLQYFICPVSQIHHRGRDIHIPIGPGDEPGQVTGKLKRFIGDIMYGREHHPWGVVIEENE